MKLLRMFRLVRILRLVRLVKSIPKLYNLLSGITEAVQAMKYVVVLTVIVIYAFGLLCTSLVRQGNIPHSVGFNVRPVPGDERKHWRPRALLRRFPMVQGVLCGVHDYLELGNPCDSHRGGQ